MRSPRQHRPLARLGLTLCASLMMARPVLAQDGVETPPPPAPRGPADVLTGPGSNPHSTPEAAVAAPAAAPSLGMRQLAGDAIPLAAAGIMQGVPVGSIEVHVRDFRNQPVAGARIRLGIMGQDQARSSHDARTDAEGVAVFRDLPTGDVQAYRVNLEDDGATTSTTPFRLPDEAGYRVEIMRLPITDDPRFLFVWQYDTSVEFTAGKLHFVQQVQLVNGGDAIVRLPNEGLRFPLPEGVVGFQSQAMMSDQRIEPDDEGFLLRGSVPPGGQTLLYGYDLPITPGTMRIAMGVPLRVRTVQVVAEEAQGIGLSVSGLPEPRIHEAPARLLVTGAQRHATEGPLGEMVITLDNIPGPGPGRLIAVTLALLLLVVGGALLTSPKDATQLLLAAREAQRDALLEQLTALEAQHAAGDVGPEFYARERASLRDALALWVKDGASVGSAGSSASAARPAS
ncbi:MAG: carboxypeptidase regulatory-like domain-containing protein [Sandaracinaceae bacterium]|nr:carboxypeptidase regulatory-like domain-containing protein [Myxococcales bacterium]MCB9658456.1 carboxypeptidase regulatory-like domain-containing protein [Sandaracinaceae bacterium]